MFQSPISQNAKASPFARFFSFNFLRRLFRAARCIVHFISQRNLGKVRESRSPSERQQYTKVSGGLTKVDDIRHRAAMDSVNGASRLMNPTIAAGEYRIAEEKKEDRSQKNKDVN